MNDKELLELAAKAAGGLVYVEEMGWIHEDADGNRGAWWNPLTDDGDALRLAVKLNLTVESWRDSAFGRANSCCTRTDINTSRELHNDDPYAATRRAIVRAAAEIGRSMK